MDKTTTITDIGMEIIRTPISEVRMHRVDNQWILEYKIKGKRFQKMFWHPEGKYAEYSDGQARAQLLATRGYVETARYRSINYKVK